MHFCPLAHICWLFSFLLIKLWTPTLSMCAQHFHVPSVCYSSRWFVKAPLPRLFSTSLDSISSTFCESFKYSFFIILLCSSSRCFRWLLAFLPWLVYCSNGHAAISRLLAPPTVKCFLHTVSQSFQSILNHFFCLKVNPWLLLLSNNKHNYYLCVPRPMKMHSGPNLSVMSVLNPLQQAERLLFFCTHCASYRKSCLSLALCTHLMLLTYYFQPCSVFWGIRAHILSFPFLNASPASAHLPICLGVCDVQLRTRS